MMDAEQEKERRRRTWDLIQSRFPELVPELEAVFAKHGRVFEEIKLYEADGGEMK